MQSDINFQISRSGLSHPARVLTNKIAFHASYYITELTNADILNTWDLVLSSFEFESLYTLLVIN